MKEFRSRLKVHLLSVNSKLGFLCPPLATSTHAAVYEKIAIEKNLVASYICCRGAYLSMAHTCFAMAALLPVIVWHLYFRSFSSFAYRGIVVGKAVLDESVSESRYGIITCVELMLIVQKLFYAILLVDVGLKVFAARKIGLVVGGDESYVYFSVLAQLAFIHHIQCFFLKGGERVSAYYFDIERLSAEYVPSKDVFLSIRPASRLAEKCRRTLTARCNGDRQSIGMPSLGSRGFDMKRKICQGLCDRYANAHWIYLHDPFDAVSIYGTNVFDSHVSWALSTVKYLYGKGQTIVVKIHPNQRPKAHNATNWLTNLLKVKYPSINILSADVSIDAISGLIPKSIITVYGSVIPEALFRNIICIAASSCSPYKYFSGLLCCNNRASYFAALDVACSNRKSETLIATPLSVLRDYAALIDLNGSRKAVEVPFDDMNEQQYKEFYPQNSYRTRNYERRSQFLFDENIYREVKQSLADVSLLEELGVQ